MTERRFPDVWVDPEDDPRETEWQPVGERETLLEYLRTQRLTFRMKCEGLDAEQLARRSVPPSTMSLLGLVRHLAGVEHHWFRQVMDGTTGPRPFRTQADPDAEFNGALPDPAVVDSAWSAWCDVVADAERIVAHVDDLATYGRMGGGQEIALREVLVHMIEEYARHNGHADLLRERIDGRTGQ